jgi:NAD dependent epimerase/dehydratase family enzyme
LLSSKLVHPRKTQDSGFRFQFPELHSALADVLV